MRFDILTLFPEAFESFLTTSLIGKAIEKEKIEVNIFDIRDFSENKHKKVDDVPYGGGAGMLMTCQPLFDSINHVKNLKKDTAPVIFFTPSKNIFDQRMAEKFAKGEIPENFKDSSQAQNDNELPVSPLSLRGADKFNAQRGDIKRFILLCGHYEGIDQRVRDELVDFEISLGNFVLTGGELPTQIFIDSIARLLPDVIGNEASHQEESFSDILGEDAIEYPHYTRPGDFRGLKVPEILLSGHHANIEKWRKENCS